MNTITFIKLNSTTPAGTPVRRVWDGKTGTLLRVVADTPDYPAHAYVTFTGEADDSWVGFLDAWELVEPRHITLATVATVGAGRATHLAYHVGDMLTGTYCDRAAWESKRVRPHHTMTAEQVTCSRCLKVAASETSVPNTLGQQR